jgi:TAT (twin-arginine translocation) pathway signal sequence
MLKNGYSHPSRRDFLGTAAGAGGAMLIGPAWWNASAEGVDSRVAQVLSGKQVKKHLIA